MSKRAERRQHLRRMKTKARKFYPWAEDRAIKWANNLAVCSNFCCGNARRHCKGHDKLTKQELVTDGF